MDQTYSFKNKELLPIKKNPRHPSVQRFLFLDQTYSFKNKELSTITKNPDTLLYSCLLLISVQNFKANGQAVLVLPHGEHDNLLFLLAPLLVHRQNSRDTIPLI